MSIERELLRKALLILHDHFDGVAWAEPLIDDIEAELVKPDEPVAWADVIGYEGLYKVSSVGEVMNCKTERLLKQNGRVGSGYVKVDLWKDNIRKQTTAHRLVAESFLGSLEGMTVNHINGIKTDNRVENLEIVTHKQNVNHCVYELSDWCKPVLATNTETGEYVTYRSVEETKHDGFDPKHVSACCKGRRKSHNGWFFRFDSNGKQSNPPRQQELDTVIAERDALKARIDGGIRVMARRSANSIISTSNINSVKNAILILDEGITL